MTGTAAYPRPVSQAAYEVFARDDPFMAELLVKRGRITITDRQEAQSCKA